ncbi:MAG TPA: phosphoribosyltransferase family protein, partial [Telluria sp.]
TKGPLSGRVLLVDDLADSGVTLQKVSAHLKENFKDVTEVKSAVIWVKGTSAYRPDYYLDDLPHNPWIHQPFEDYDGLRPHQLAAWMKKFEK